jgi:predicted aspartyl protease
MLKRILIIIAIFFALASYYAIRAQAQSVTVDLQHRVNLIVVEVTINGVAKNFILDTGASSTVIDSKTAEELSLPEVGKGEAVVAGTKISVSMVEVDSIGIDSIVLYDFMCGVANISNVKALLGEDIAGVLGFDFLSKFEMTLDYCNKQITFDKCQVVPSEPICVEDSAIVPGFGIVRMPNDFWECTTETPMRQIPVAFYNTRYSGLAATLQIQDHEIKGITSLASIVPAFELQLKSQIENFEKLSGQASKLGNKEIYVLEYKGSEQGIGLKFKHIFIVVKENLFSIICYAPIERFDSLEHDFDELIANIQFEE